jgi:hypothetical protein
LSAEKATTQQGIALPPIVWVVRSESSQYGMIGCIKAFSIWSVGARYRLDPRLPGRDGVVYTSREHKTIELAKEAAQAIYDEWRGQLEKPYDGQFKEAS